MIVRLIGNPKLSGMRSRNGGSLADPRSSKQYSPTFENQLAHAKLVPGIHQQGDGTTIRIR